MGRPHAGRTLGRFPIGRTNVILAWLVISTFGTKDKKMALPEVGSTALGFTLPNQDGKSVSLGDYAGNNVLIWFYPRAFGRN